MAERHDNASSAIPPLVGFVGLCLAVGWLSGLVTETSVAAWYPTLVKPAWTPPNLAFPIIWTLLYVMMGVAAALVWRAAGPTARRRPLGLFALQLALNCLWTLLFFGLRNPLLGLVDILALIAALIATIIAFRPINRAAALLLVPYALWAGYATTLNYFIWRWN